MVDLPVQAVDAALCVDAEDGLEKSIYLSAVSYVRRRNRVAVFNFFDFQPLQDFFDQLGYFHLHIHEDCQLLLAVLPVHGLSQQLQSPSISAVGVVGGMLRVVGLLIVADKLAHAHLIVERCAVHRPQYEEGEFQPSKVALAGPYV